jgi:hypothetical protein
MFAKVGPVERTIGVAEFAKEVEWMIDAAVVMDLGLKNFL